MIPNIPYANKCNNHCLIGLMRHILKIFIQILHMRMVKLLEEVGNEKYFGFKNGIQTTKSISINTLTLSHC